MKSYQLLVASALALQVAGFGVALANDSSPFPSDAEADYNLPALETRADRIARMGGGSDETWGVSRRESNDPFPHDNAPYGVQD